MRLVSGAARAWKRVPLIAESNRNGFEVALLHANHVTITRSSSLSWVPSDNESRQSYAIPWCLGGPLENAQKVSRRHPSENAVVRV